MKKRIFTAFLVITVLTIVLYGCSVRQNRGEPVTFTTSSSVRELTIDDKIREAQIIVIGEVKTRLPSKWELQDQKDVKNATPQEISDVGLFTDFLISIDQTLKGSFDEPIIRVRAFSGETEQVRWINSSQPSYTKGHVFLLFLSEGRGPTAHVDPGHYRSVNSSTAVYEIVDGKAISSDDEWVLDELIAYIRNSLAAETSPPMPFTDTPVPADPPTETIMPTSTSAAPLTETPLPFTDTPAPTDLLTETMLPIEPTNPAP